MKKGSIAFLQVVNVLVGIGVLGFMIWEPQVEGRNVHATQFEIYFNDAFLAYAYVASIPFFVALYQVHRVLGFRGQGKSNSQMAVRALRIVEYCAIAIIGFVTVGEAFILASNSDDRAGGVFMGLLITVGSLAMGTGAAMCRRRLQDGGGVTDIAQKVT